MNVKEHVMKNWSIAIVTLILAVMAGCVNEPSPANHQGTGTTQTPVRAFMKQKLAYAQSILEGIAIEDFKKIEAAAQQLYMLSEATDWAVHKTLPYMKYSADFRMLADDMMKNAKQRKLEAVTLGYMELTMTCVRCHSHLRNEGLVIDTDFGESAMSGISLSKRLGIPE